MRDEDIEAAVVLLQRSPAWADLEPGAAAKAAEIVSILDQLAAYDLDTLRSAIARYIEQEGQAPGGPGVSAMSKLYVLNRYLFVTSDREPSGQRRYGAFHGIPAGDTWVDELWPLSVNAAGTLELTGQFGGYFGETYLALQEFDAFRQRFDSRRTR